MRQELAYVFGYIAIMSVIALVAYMIGHPPPHVPPEMAVPYPSPEPLDEHALNQMFVLFAVISVALAVCFSPPSLRPGHSWWKCILTACSFLAALNALFVWMDRDSWVLGTMWLFHHYAFRYWSSAVVVIAGTVWFLYCISRLPGAIYRTYREFREVYAIRSDR